MSFGISLQCFNHAQFGNRVRLFGRSIPVGILTEFLPQILFFWSIFGYLVFLIIFKWLKHYENPGNAPGLLNTLIYMFLSPGTVEVPLFRGQVFRGISSSCRCCLYITLLVSHYITCTGRSSSVFGVGCVYLCALDVAGQTLL